MTPRRSTLSDFHTPVRLPGLGTPLYILGLSVHHCVRASCMYRGVHPLMSVRGITFCRKTTESCSLRRSPEYTSFTGPSGGSGNPTDTGWRDICVIPTLEVTRTVVLGSPIDPRRTVLISLVSVVSLVVGPAWRTKYT